MFFLVEKTFSASQKHFSEAETIFFESEKCFCITQKIVGEAPTIFVTTQQINERGYYRNSTHPNCVQVHGGTAAEKKYRQESLITILAS
jgi:hypothetical protein